MGAGAAKVCSPEIIGCECGVVKVRDSVKGEVVYKDCKLFPGGSMEWDWAVTGTHHKPGIQLADVEHVKNFGEKNCVVVFGTGMCDGLGITPTLIEYLKEHQIEYLIAKTPEAIRMYNKLIQCDRLAIALIHSGC
ncbi:MAG: putative mth938 domain-containing protein [Harvfovirus sp.]|uniref:Putative mth938 domain-containing protein n=1 Tax=Harvfovirus sp. TaxID=2487768 RepID=A0A3G5A3K8_9VIRU|nr:MAG: putative mth938 domain-containing protein [Harvfovirus sp.]